LRRYRDFCDFQDGGCRHLGFSKIRNFNGRWPICVIMPNFVKISQAVAVIWQFNGFLSKWRPSAILDLLGAYWVQNLVEIDAVVFIT